MRVLKIVLALVALPFAVGVAQGNSQSCNAAQAAEAARARAAGRPVPAGLAKKDCGRENPPPPVDQPPSGMHWASGIVYEDIDGNGSRDAFAGEMGLSGWTVRLIWSGRVVAEVSTDADGYFEFRNLGNSTWTVCVVQQAGYTRTQPVSESACGGAGYEFPLAGSFETMYEARFGMMLQ